jgi:hypothetical protein
MSKPAIKLMPDYHCWPLWHHGGPQVGNVDPDELGITEGLAAKLRAWAATYDSHLNLTDPASTTWTTEEEKLFDEEGRRLWRELAAEVGDRYSVFYFDAQTATCVSLEPANKKPNRL